MSTAKVGGGFCLFWLENMRFNRIVEISSGRDGTGHGANMEIGKRDTDVTS